MTGLQFCFKRLVRQHHAFKINWDLKVELMGLKVRKVARIADNFRFRLMSLRGCVRCLRILAVKIFFSKEIFHYLFIAHFSCVFSRIVLQLSRD